MGDDKFYSEDRALEFRHAIEEEMARAIKHGLHPAELFPALGYCLENLIKVLPAAAQRIAVVGFVDRMKETFPDAWRR